jgi:hypothetical protein
MSSHLLCCAAAAAAATLVSASAWATTVLPGDFGEMVSASQVIVHARVVDVRSAAARDAAATRRSATSIESTVTVSVLEALKGSPGPRVAFRVPNGQVGRYRRVTVGAPEFAVGDEVILFLKGAPPGLPSVFGLNQGVYRVNRTGATAVVRPVAGGAAVRGDPSRRPLDVIAFARAVRALSQP